MTDGIHLLGLRTQDRLRATSRKFNSCQFSEAARIQRSNLQNFCVFLCLFVWSCSQCLCECVHVHSVLYQSSRQIYNPADLSLSRDVIICPPILMLCMCQCYYLGQVNGARGPKVKVYFHEKVEDLQRLC